MGAGQRSVSPLKHFQLDELYNDRQRREDSFMLNYFFKQFSSVLSSVNSFSYEVFTFSCFANQSVAVNSG